MQIEFLSTLVYFCLIFLPFVYAMLVAYDNVFRCFFKCFSIIFEVIPVQNHNKYFHIYTSQKMFKWNSVENLLKFLYQKNTINPENSTQKKFIKSRFNKIKYKTSTDNAKTRGLGSKTYYDVEIEDFDSNAAVFQWNLSFVRFLYDLLILSMFLKIWKKIR